MREARDPSGNVPQKDARQSFLNPAWINYDTGRYPTIEAAAGMARRTGMMPDCRQVPTPELGVSGSPVPGRTGVVHGVGIGAGEGFTVRRPRAGRSVHPDREKGVTASEPASCDSVGRRKVARTSVTASSIDKPRPISTSVP